MTRPSRDPRKVFGAAVTEAAERDQRVVALSVDSGLSSGLGPLRARHPDRYFEFGIMEQAATGIASGLATTGKVPILCAIAPFVTVRNYEMFRNDLGYMRQNVKIVGRNGGLSYSQLGPTHHSLEDYAITRMIPGVVVLSPQDCGEIEAAVTAMIDHVGPVYMRIGAGLIPDLFDDESFVIGRGRIIRSGSEVTVISTGQLTANVMNAVAMLEKRGISAEHIGLPTVWPLDENLILESVARTGRAVTVEEHYEVGGLGGAVAELLAAKHPAALAVIGVPHEYVSSGPYEDVLEHCGLDSDSIAERIEEFIRTR